MGLISKLQAAHAEVHDEGVFRAGDPPGTQGCVGECSGPVHLVHLETGAFELEGGVQVDFLEIGDEGNLYLSHRACMSLSFL